jgi:arginine/serine-rich splicing factor 4/5/6
MSSKNPEIYVGGISRKTTHQDLDKLFDKYGKIDEIHLKDRYAFVKFVDYHGA